jgi:hypothetical protein
MRTKTGKTLLMAAAVSLATAAIAAETLTYRYDARGRLVKVERSGSVNNGVNTSYGYDKANNRNSMNVSGAP